VLASLVTFNGQSSGDDAPGTFWGELTMYSPVSPYRPTVYLASGSAANGNGYFYLHDANGNNLFSVDQSGTTTITSINSTGLIKTNVPGTGPQIAANFGNSDGGVTTSEVRIVFSEGGNYYQGISGKYNNGDPSLIFSTSNTVNTWGERMRITSSGRVGIGTASPAGLCDISNGTSHLVLEPRGSAAGIGLAVGSDIGEYDAAVLNLVGGLQSGAPSGGVNIAYFRGSWDAALSIRNVTSGFGSLLLMQSGGHVLIGTTTDNGIDALQLYGSLAVAGVQVISNVGVLVGPGVQVTGGIQAGGGIAGTGFNIQGGPTGTSGTFKSADTTAKTITVTNGIITGIV
jgi:hypothetical protein